MPYKDKQKDQEYQKAYRIQNADRLSKQAHEYYLQHKDTWNKLTPEQSEKLNTKRRERWNNDPEYREKRKAESRKYHSTDEFRKKRALADRIKNRLLRQQLLQLLGNKCVKCDFIDVRALQVEHKKGGGRAEQRKFNGTQRMYKYYLDNPKQAKKQLQVMCANCNWIKRIEKREYPYKYDEKQEYIVMQKPEMERLI